MKDILAKYVARQRQASGYSQNELASRINEYGIPWHQTVVSKIEAKERELSAEELIRLLQILGSETLSDQLIPHLLGE